MSRPDPYMQRERKRALQVFVSMRPAAIAHEIEMVQTRIDREVAAGAERHEYTNLSRKRGKARGDLVSCLVARIEVAKDRQPAGTDRPPVLELVREDISKLEPTTIVARCDDVSALWQTEGVN